MNKTLRCTLSLMSVLGLAACDSGSTDSSDLALDGVTTQDSDTRYTVGEVIKLDASIKNTGDSTSRSGEVHVYRSVDADLTSIDTHLGRFPVDDLSAGATEDNLIPVASGGWTPGHYYLGVCNVRLDSGVTSSCKTLEVDVLASGTLSGLVPGALVSDRTSISQDANGNEVVSLGQTLAFNSAATDSYSVAVYRSESLDRDETAAQIGFFTVSKDATVWRATFDASSWTAGKDYYFSACWANGGLANNLNDCYQMAFPVSLSARR